jgi:hypothetical protein
MKISYIVLAHEPVEQLLPLLTGLLAQGSNIYLHYDLKAHDDVERLYSLNELGLPGFIFLGTRCVVKWGEWSIPQATLNCLRKIDFDLDDSDFFMLISGSCYPTKPLEIFKEFLNLNPLDFIECVNATKRRWVTGGIQNERWERYHFFNYRSQLRRFHTSLYIQKKIGIKRRLPHGLTPYIGSQWWCLRRSTILKILGFIGSRPDIEKYFATTCIPDESFFQTLVGNLIPKYEYSSQHLTEYKFNSWGVPRVYYNDDFSELALSPLYFARKVSPGAQNLTSRLLSVYANNSEEYKELIASKSFALEMDGGRTVRLLYNEARRSWQLGLMEAHSYSRISNPIVILASPSKSILNSCLRWFSGLERFIVLPDQESFSNKSLFSVIYEYADTYPGKTFVISSQAWSRQQFLSLATLFLETDLVLLPGHIGIKAPHEADGERISFISKTLRRYDAMSTNVVDLYTIFLRSYQFGRRTYQSRPLFSNLICVCDKNGRARVGSFESW